MSEIRHQWRRTISPFVSECICKTGVKEEIINEFYNDGIMSDDDSWKCFLECVGLKLKVVSSSGEINIKKAADVFSHIDITLAKKCVPIAGPDACQSTYLFKTLMDISGILVYICKCAVSDTLEVFLHAKNKMKICAFLLFFALYDSFTCNVTMSDVRKLWRRAVAPVMSECICETGVKQETVDGYYNDGILPDDPAFGCFLRCAGLKLQIFSSTGDVDIQRLVDTFDYVDTALVRKCTSTCRKDACQSAYLLLKCFDNELSKRFPP
ncbi:hypothetical protein ILUMI_03912 [Ignelater luminosus]|uniref:Uncharacterized protein n=1 Tax=Ignelater luminosus TaxID=2038154 RepID=A0A8K0DAN3_IGNLU|nr:hypothetical protein ILUMI_03912 [Ignelater luminosus]